MAIPLRSLLTIPFVLQVVSLTSLVGFFSYRSSQSTIEQFARHIMKEMSEHIVTDFDRYLQSAHDINQSHIAAVQFGAIDLQNLDDLHRYLTFELTQDRMASAFTFGTARGDARIVEWSWDSETAARSSVLDNTLLRIRIVDNDVPSESRVYSLDESGRPQKLIETLPAPNIREQIWYQQAVATGQPGWTEPSNFAAGADRYIDAYAPLYGQYQEPLGVFSVRLSLDKLSHFLSTIPMSENGLAFIVRKDGLLVASNRPAPNHAEQPNDDELTVKVGHIDAQNRVESSTLEFALRHLEQLPGGIEAVSSAYESTLHVGDELQFLKVVPYRDDYGLDWRIVLLIPQSDFAGEIYADVRRMMILCEIALITSLIFVALIARRVTRPLKRLNQATLAYAVGARTVPLHPSSVQEIETLRSAFESMVAKLDTQKQEIDEFHTNYQRSLENEIAERTSTLERTTSQLKEAQRIAHVGSWEFDIVAQRLSWSEQLFQIMGRPVTAGEPSPDEVFAIVHPEDRYLFRQTLKRAITDGVAYNMELRVLHPDGTLRYLANRGEGLLDAHNKVTRLVGTSTDVTEHKKSELILQKLSQELSEWRDRYKMATWAGKQSIFEYDVLADQYTWDSHLSHILGYSPQEAPRTFIESVRLIHPDDFPLFRKMIHRGTNASLCTIELRLRRKDGTYVWVEEWGTLQRDEQGQLVTVVGSLRDISDRKQVDLALEESVSTLRQITENLPIFFGLRSVDNQNWLYINTAFESITGYPIQCMYEQAAFYQKLIHPDDLKSLEQHTVFEENGSPREQVFRIVKASQEIRWIRMIEFPVYSQSGEILRVAVSAQDITHWKKSELELKLLNAQLQELATTDSLTKIPNRRQFRESLNQIWRQHQREQQSLALLMLDIDHFKKYNDHYGHPSGDRCLYSTAQLLTQCVYRPGDLIARYGGEEFMILLSNTKRKGAVEIARRIQKAMARLAIPHQMSGVADHVTFSIGIVVVDMPNAVTCEQAIAEADKMLYQAKQIRNTYCISKIS